MMLNLKVILSALSVVLAQGALDPDGRLMVGQTFLVNEIDPTKDSNPWSLTSHGIAEKLFTVDEHGEIVGQVGQSVVKIDENTWDVTIKPNYKFSDGTVVDAVHVAACLAEQNAKNGNAQSSLGSINTTATDSLTVRIESEKPTHIMDSVLAEWAFVVCYHRASDNKFFFTGPYVYDHFEPNDHMDLSPNPYYPGADDRPKIEISKYANGHELAKGVEEGKVDLGFHLPIDTLEDLRKVEGIEIKSFEVGYHYMAFYNIDTLPDVKVRQALDIAIDRTVLSQELRGGHATRSLFPRDSPFYTDDSDAHGDDEAAAALLNEAGWVLNSDGKRMKDSELLTVTLVAYPHRPGLGIMQPRIADAWTDLGITVETILTGMEWSETATIIHNRTFDVLMWAQHTLPAGDPAWFLNTFFHSDGSNNHPNFSSDHVDGLLESMANADTHDQRVLLTAAAQEGIHSEVPVSNLVTPEWHVSISDSLKDYKPYGSDYYIIRADLRVNYNEETSGSANNLLGSCTMVAGFVALILGIML